MIVIILFLLLFISFILHLFFLTGYIRTRGPNYLNKFITTAITNVIFSAGLIFLALYMPEKVREINFSLLLWFICGSIMIMMLSVQVVVFKRAYHRAQLPENYHYNFFGKKVLHNTVLNPTELGIFFASIPFLLLCGAYFVAKLIRFFV
jgi:hypothetical protein